MYIKLEGSEWCGASDKSPNHGIVDEDVGVCHLCECKEGIVHSVEPGAGCDELVHEERVLVGIVLDHGGMDGFEALECTAFLKLGGD